MQLRALDIANFRSLGALSLPELGRVNLLVGKNNCGKTTVLEALRVLASNASLATMLELAVEREDVGLNESRDRFTSKGLVSSLFKDYSIETSEILIGERQSSHHLRMSQVHYLFVQEEEEDGVVRGRRQVLTAEETHRIASEDPDAELRQALRVAFGNGESDLIRLDRVLSSGSLEASAERRDLLTPCAYVPARPNDVNDLAILWDQIALTEREQQVIEALKLIEPAIQGLTFVESDPLIDEARRMLERRFHSVVSRRSARRIPLVKLQGSDLRVPLRSMGDGLHRVLDVVLSLVSIQNGLFLIDEFENGLHYSIHDKLWKLIYEIAAQRSVQVFVTTHSDDCVDAFARVSVATDEVGVLYRIARPASGDQEHFVKRYSEANLADARNAEVEVR